MHLTQVMRLDWLDLDHDVKGDVISMKSRLKIYCKVCKDFFSPKLLNKKFNFFKPVHKNPVFNFSKKNTSHSMEYPLFLLFTEYYDC